MDVSRSWGNDKEDMTSGMQGDETNQKVEVIGCGA